ncbi:DEAD/DEAH box helicase family protein [Mammaliicoccus lentus]|uniref:DEAD/DEAH box helicase family protein n=1 Tax=Mammaliicoccus lentus TaxID=42858 RepID=UPI00107161A6|nr:DEAD/DEAH box helicase family protein [Mammaliicoccus lentus]MBF0748897.1 DEAD/DEAH box helicase family protein [Mammaliicoccus lentus]TFU58496.1 DEAD/DEAH box helicase [Mammaliicoccus lentus]
MINYANYKNRYVSFKDNLIEQFYKPIILETNEYKRMSGYFSSSIIDNVYEEIYDSHIQKGYKIKLICSPQLTPDDHIAISEGYELKKIIENNIITTIDNLENETLPFITHLIAIGVIDIKFVTTLSGEGLFHAKEGIFIDENGRKIGFIGSNNETSAAVKKNFETAMIFKGDDDLESITDMESTFDQIWNNEIEELVQCGITPSISKAFEHIKEKILIKKSQDKNKRVQIMDRFDLYDYQKDAINSWEVNNYVGLLEMATGTGKTITAIACQERLQKKYENVVTFIVAPQIDLVEQWYEELKHLNIKSLKCSSAESNYKELLKSRLSQKSSFEDPIIVITTSNTFSSDSFQSIIKLHLRNEAMLICDEVHSFGAEKMRTLYKKQEENFKFRLGVSATPYRKDETESEELINFFDKVVFQYTLKDAIENNFLNEYNYIPVILTFDKNELKTYRKNMTETLNETKSDKAILKEVERLTTTIANANTGKVEKLKSLLDEINIKNPKIIYCSPGNYNDGTNVHGTRHIDFVAKEIGIHGCRLRKIYSEIPSNERQEILEQFKNHDIDTLLAIKCLDQGVNLKEVTHAYILSSTDSLTEFIQRRGRILRKSEKKPISYIYDLIMLPESIEDIYFNPIFEDAYLVDRELRRMKEYNYAATNQKENQKLINDIEEAYIHVLEELENGKDYKQRY